MSITVDIVTDTELLGQVEANVPKSTLVPHLPLNLSGMIDSIISFAGENKIEVFANFGVTAGHIIRMTEIIRTEISRLAMIIFKSKSFENHRNQLTRLTLFFTKSARVELRGCSPAKGNGKDMMVKLAQIWGVNIHGSTENQILIFWKRPVFIATHTQHLHLWQILLRFINKQIIII